MPAAMDAVQMNVRIDRELKREGDAALATVGYTPSQAVRLLWEIAVSLRDRPQELAAFLRGPSCEYPESTCQQKEEIQDEKLLSFREGQRMVNGMIGKLGISTDYDPSEPSLEELREQMALERLYGEDSL